MASKAVVIHKEKTEAELTARVTACLKRLNEKMAVDAVVAAQRQFEQLKAMQYAKFVPARESLRERLVAQGVIR